MKTVDLDGAAQAIDAFLRALGHEPTTDPDLAGTGRRVAQAFAEDLLAGYREDPRALLAREAIATPLTRPTLVQVAPISIVTMCPHHLLPAEGSASIAFFGKHLVGVGAIVAAARAASRRLVLQETLGEDLASMVDETLAPSWVAVALRLGHGCMRHRGERANEASVTTVATRGSVPEGYVARLLSDGKL